MGGGGYGEQLEVKVWILGASMFCLRQIISQMYNYQEYLPVMVGTVQETRATFMNTMKWKFVTWKVTTWNCFKCHHFSHTKYVIV